MSTRRSASLVVPAISTFLNSLFDYFKKIDALFKVGEYFPLRQEGLVFVAKYSVSLIE